MATARTPLFAIGLLAGALVGPASALDCLKDGLTIHYGHSAFASGGSWSVDVSTDGVSYQEFIRDNESLVRDLKMRLASGKQPDGTRLLDVEKRSMTQSIGPLEAELTALKARRPPMPKKKDLEALCQRFKQSGFFEMRQFVGKEPPFSDLGSYFIRAQLGARTNAVSAYDLGKDEDSTLVSFSDLWRKLSEIAPPPREYLRRPL